MVGQTLGHYSVEEQLGAGGMGVVYKATDTTLGRTVALKLLHDGFSDDSEWAARFDREARLLASLNHTNIAAIYGLERDGARVFLVLEYVPGATLAERLARGPLPQRLALALAAQIAGALEVAHERGIIHRDLKPANIKVTDDEHVKVLDFGLAKALENAPGATMAETMTRDATMQGVILGTAPYMSPEQACGKPLDSRTDIWSFGCVLYEALTGHRTFTGDTATEVIAGIVEREPDWSALSRARVPENIAQLLRRCLQKDPRSRLRSIGDARIEIEETLAGRVQVTAPARRPRSGVVAVAVAGGILLGGVPAVGWVWGHTGAAEAAPVVRFTIDLPQGQFFRPTWNPQIGFSPDGKTLAYSHPGTGIPTGRTYLRRLDEVEDHALAADLPPMPFQSFSPDGTEVLLMDSGRQLLKKVAVSGGAPVEVAAADFIFRGDWGPDNYYYWTSQYFGPIIRTPASGGKPEPVTELNQEKEERTHRHPVVLPGGKAIMFTVSAGGMQSFDDARIDAFTLDTKKTKTLIEGGFAARYTDGHIVYARGGNLYVVAFDAIRLEVTGTPIKIVEGVFMSTNSGAANFDVSSGGALAYVAGKAEGGERTLVWVDRHGKPSPLSLPPRAYVFPRISPDGRRLAFEVEGVNHDLYTYEPDRDVTTRMTTDGMSHAPVWTPDGKRLAFRSWRAGTMTMWWMPADRSAPEERLTNVGVRQSVDSFSPDGRFVAFNQMTLGTTGYDVWVLPMDGARTPVPFVRSKFAEGSARFSPDGKWVAYCTQEPGTTAVYVQPWPGPGPKIQVSSDGGTDPIWSSDGKELFYRNGDKMMVVPVSTQPTFKAGRPEVLWEGHYSHGMSSSCGPAGTTETNYDVSRDGQHFLMIKDADQDVISTRIVVVLNFLEELKKRR